MDGTLNVNPVDVAMGALVVPPIIAIINQRRWPSQVKGLVALAVCLLYALAVVWIRGGVDLQHWRNSALVIGAAAFAMYKLWWQPSGIAPAIEAVTSTDTPRVPPSATTTGGDPVL